MPHADLEAEEWIPNWRDKHNVVHIMGSHSATQARTVCGYVVVARIDGRDWENYYESIRDAPTCIDCIGIDLRWESEEDDDCGRLVR